MNLSLRRTLAITRANLSILGGSLRIGGNKTKALNSGNGKGAMIGFGILMLFLGASYSVPTVFAMAEQYDILGSDVVFTMMKNIYMLGLFFGFSLVYASFFSGEDVEHFLPLPVQPSELVIGKIAATTVFISVIFGLYSLPGFITFGVLSNAGPVFYLLLPLIILMSAGLLTSIFGTLNILIAGFASLFKRARRTVAYTISALMGVVLLGYYLFSSATMYIKQSPSENPVMRYIEYLLMGYGPSKVLTGEALWSQLGLFALNVLFYFLLFALVGQLLYVRALAGISTAAAKRSKLKAGELERSAGGGNARMTYLAKEFRMLIRSPMVAMNSLVGGFIFPLMIIGGIIYLSVGGTDTDLVELKNMLNSLDFSAMPAVFLGVSFIAGLFISGMNLLGASAISREGGNLFFMKYIPLPVYNQILIKYVFAAAVGSVATLMGILPVALFMGLSIQSALLTCLAAVSGALLSQAIGLLFDVYSPYLNWDVDYKAVKQNINFLWWSLVCIALAVGSAALMQIPLIPLWAGILLFILLPSALLAGILNLLRWVSKKSFARLI